MNVFPVYQDILGLYEVRYRKLPFYAAYNVISDYPLHYHDLIELSLVAKGEGREIINGRGHRLRPGTICLLAPYHVHRYIVYEERPIELYCCMFDTGLLFQTLADPEMGHRLLSLADEANPFFDLPDVQFERVRQLFADMMNEYGGSDYGKNSLLRARLAELLTLFARYHPGVTQSSRPFDTRYESGWTIIQYVHRHFQQQDLSLEMLARQFHVSIPYVTKTFKELVGLSFLQYVHRLRIRQACGLLATSGMKIVDVACEVGFDSVRSFSRVFKERVGVSASEYRESPEKHLF